MKDTNSWSRMHLLCAIGLSVWGASAAAQDACPNRGQLDTLYCDANKDLVADVPADKSKQRDPSTLVWAYTPVEDPAVYANIFKPFTEHLEKCVGKRTVYFPVQSNAAEIEAMRSGRLHFAGFQCAATTVETHVAWNANGVPIVQIFQLDKSFGADGIAVRGNINGFADLKGKKVGVTAPGSSTNVMVNFILAKAGLKPSDVSIIGVGAAQGAVAAMRSGQIDAISNLDPVITLLQRSGDLKIVSDTRVVAEADKVFGGPMPAGCFYAPQAFIDKHPNTTQALTNALVRANKWIQAAGPSDIINNVPEAYLLGDRAVYIDAFLAAKGALSPDGMIPEKGAATAQRALASIDPEFAKAKVDLAATWTNDFVKHALARHPVRVK